MYEKPLNLYQYISPNSAHSPSVLRGFIIGLVLRIFRLTTHHEDCKDAIQLLFDRLCGCGFTPDLLLPLFSTAFKKVSQPALPREQVDMDETLFFHTVFNPFGPSSAVLQHAFRTTILNPPNEPRLTDIRNQNDQRYGAKLRTRRLVVAHHRAPNIKNLLFPRKLREDLGRPPSEVFATMQPTPPSIPPPVIANPYLT